MPSTESAHRPYIGVFGPDIRAVAEIRKHLRATLPGSSVFSANTVAGMTATMGGRWPDLLVLLMDDDDDVHAILRWVMEQGKTVPTALIAPPRKPVDAPLCEVLGVAILRSESAEPDDIGKLALLLLRQGA